jgi:hypothetical protein
MTLVEFIKEQRLIGAMPSAGAPPQPKKPQQKAAGSLASPYKPPRQIQISDQAAELIALAIKDMLRNNNS